MERAKATDLTPVAGSSEVPGMVAATRREIVAFTGPAVNFPAATAPPAGWHFRRKPACLQLSPSETYFIKKRIMYYRLIFRNISGKYAPGK